MFHFSSFFLIHFRKSKKINPILFTSLSAISPVTPYGMLVTAHFCYSLLVTNSWLANIGSSFTVPRAWDLGGNSMDIHEPRPRCTTGTAVQDWKKYLHSLTHFVISGYPYRCSLEDHKSC